MALVHADGFGHYSSSQYSRIYQASNGLVFPSSLSGTVSIGAYGPNGRPGQRFSGAFDDGLNILSSSVPSGATYIVQTHFKASSLHSVNAILGPILSSDFQCCLALDGSGNFKVYRGSASGTLLDTVSYTYTAGTYVYIVFKVVLSTTVGTVDVKIYETSDYTTPAATLSLTGENTQAGATATWDGHHRGAATNDNTDYADYVVMDGSGSALNDMQSPMAASTLFASTRAPGTRSEWTNSSGSISAALLNDTTPDDDSGYVSSSTQNQRETVFVDPLPNPSRTVLGAMLYLCAKQGSGAPTIVPLTEQSATEYTGTSYSPGASYAYATQPYSAMPDGSAFSTAAAFDALEWGAKLTSASDPARLTQVAVVVLQALTGGKRNTLTGYAHAVTGDDNLIAGQGNTVVGSASEAHGVNGTVVANRSVLFNLDGTVRSLSTNGMCQVGGDLDVTGTLSVSGTATMPDPVNDSDAATKQYVDDSIAALVDTRQITFPFDGGGSVLSTGNHKNAAYVDYACTITKATLYGDGGDGSIVVDLYSSTYASFPPTSGGSITASAQPTISSAKTSQDSTLSGWTTSIAAGTFLLPNIDSVSTFTWACLVLTVTVP